MFMVLGGAALLAGAIAIVAGSALGASWRNAGFVLVILSVVLMAGAMVGGKRKGGHP